MLAAFPFLPKATVPCKTGKPPLRLWCLKSPAPQKAKASPCSSSSRDGQGARTRDVGDWRSPHRWECQAHLAQSWLPGASWGHQLDHELGAKGLHSSSHPLLHAEARGDRTEEEQEKGMTFFGERSPCFWACTRRNHSSHPPQGWVARSLLVRQNFLQRCY